MTTSLKKTAIGALAALSLGLAFASPAKAWGGYGWGPGAVVAGVITGAVVGSAIANSNGPGPYAGDCWLERRPVYDEYGNVIGRRRVRVCR